eukprot:scaffold381_cov150-Isochrysis_galbana.AAC.2
MYDSLGGLYYASKLQLHISSPSVPPEPPPYIDIDRTHITREAIQATLARKCPPTQMQATLQEDIPNFIQKLHDVDTSEVLGVGVARVRASGPRMLAWITYGGPDRWHRRPGPGKRRAVLILLL